MVAPMTAIPLDQFSQIARRQRSTRYGDRHARLTHPAADPMTPPWSAFGPWLTDYMAQQSPPITQAELARRVRADPRTVNRWCRSEVQPSTEHLKLLAPVLGVPYGQLLVRAGHGDPGAELPEAPRPPRLDPLAAELGRMLDPDSPLDDETRTRLRLIVNQVMEAERKNMRRRRRSA